MLSRPTVGRSISSTAETSALPMIANCNSCSGVQSTLAPRSSARVTPLRVGNCEAIAGRSMPGRVLSTKREIAISAPVLPADTQACATPSFTRSTATRIDESFLRRRASAGGSCISTTSVVARMLGSSKECWRAVSSTRWMASLPPTRMTCASGVASRNRNDAATVTGGPWSPPIASTAIVTGIGSMRTRQRPSAKKARRWPPGSGLDVGLGLDDLLAPIVTARADVMTPMHFTGDRLDRERRIGQKVVGAMHVALGRRFLVLLNSHLGSLLRGSTGSLLERGEPREGRRRVSFRLAAGFDRLRRRRTLRLGMHRREGQRKQQLVFDQRHRIERRRGEKHFRLLRVQLRQLGFVAREQQFGPLPDRRVERLQTTLTLERQVTLDGQRQRRPAESVVQAFDPPRNHRRARRLRQPVTHAWPARHVSLARKCFAAGGQSEGVEPTPPRASGRCPAPCHSHHLSAVDAF